MPINLGPTEWVIILVIVILLFGVGRIGRLGEDFGRAISEFRKAVAVGDGTPHRDPILRAGDGHRTARLR